MQRLLVVLLFGLLCGGIMGAYAMSTLYGRGTVNEPRPAELVALDVDKICPPCPTCAVCPPQVDCEVAPPVIGPQELGQVMGSESEVISEMERTPGLPVSALIAVVSGLDTELESCRTSSIAKDWSGSLVVDLTVTATGGIARVSKAEIVQTDGNVEGFGTCFMQSSQRLNLEWPHDDGQGRLRQAFSAVSK